MGDVKIEADVTRIERDLMALGKIGETADGGVTRRSFTETDRKGRNFIVGLMKGAGLDIWVDIGGNIHGRRVGTNPELPPVLTGSHSDSVENGGKFDGAAGIIAAIEALRALADAGIETEHSLEAVSFFAEEPSYFNTTCLGSRIAAGEFTDTSLLERTDDQGRTLQQACDEMDIDTGKFHIPIDDPQKIKALIELHVEQGSVLYEKKIPIGIITDIVASTRYRVTFLGQADHAGATPMNARRDALTAASEAILAVERIANEYSDRDVVATVGVIECHPGMVNAVPGHVQILVEVRGRAHFSKEIPAAEIVEAVRTICRNRSVDVEIEQIVQDTSREVSPEIIDILRQCTEKRGYSYLMMPSRAGHDALHIQNIAPAGMIFLPSKDGIGHDPREWTDMEDLRKGINVLAEALMQLAGK